MLLYLVYGVVRLTSRESLCSVLTKERLQTVCVVLAASRVVGNVMLFHSFFEFCVPLDCFCVFWFPVVRFIFFLPLVSHFVGIERLWVYNMIMIWSLLFLHFPVHFVSTFNLCLKFWGYIWILQGKKKELIFIWKLWLHSVFVLGFSFFPLPSPLLPGGGALFCFCLSALVVFKHVFLCLFLLRSGSP